MTIQLTSIDMSDRGRTTYTGIEDLADNIESHGLIQPIVVAPNASGGYTLVAGGRRLSALQTLGVTELHHGVSSEPGRYGYVLKSEMPECSNELSTILAEISENLNRQDLHWQDELNLIVKAYTLAKREASLRGERLLMQDFGTAIGCGYNNLYAAVAIADEVAANPEAFADATSIRGALAVKLRIEADKAATLAGKKLLEFSATDMQVRPVLGEASSEDAASTDEEVVPTVHLSTQAIHANGIEYMSSLDPASVDHIFTDPDYAVSVDRLEANSSNAAVGVAQHSIEDSLSDLRSFLTQAARVLRPHGFCVFWYDLDHHEKLQSYAASVGFAVQRWPLLWRKTGFASNAAPLHNFCKNVEYVMVCRKPGATLKAPQISCVFDCGAGSTARDFNHPFAKPFAVWRWLYDAIASKGDIVLDPFAGSGSAPCAAIRLGLKPLAVELQEQHHTTLLLNMRQAYVEMYGNLHFQ
jgi:site-specific DNA-methyltransferase (adenine-specific)